jgi:linoleoyl-CoA desaturase
LGRSSDAPPGKASDPRKVIFSKDAAGFLTELRRRVDHYFMRTGKSRNGGWPMYLKTAIILTAFVASYVMLVFEAQTWWQGVPLAIVGGAVMAG